MKRFVIAVLMLGACRFDIPEFVPPGGSVDASISCQPNAIECDDAAERYVECDEDGAVVFAMDCPLGCATGVEKCLDVDPSNDLAEYLDMASDGPEIAFSGSSTIDTTTGDVTNAGAAVTLPTATTLSGIRVYWFRSLTIGGTLKVTGGAPLALVVDGDVTITGLLDVSGDATQPGPGAVAGAQPCRGGNVGPTTNGGGGGGGGRTHAGGAGGDGSTALGGAGGDALDDPDIAPLRGGCSGGSTSAILTGTTYTSEGGGAGGAAQVVSRTEIALTSSGKIDASGGGGGTPTFPSGTVAGPGGGSGGAVLLEAPSVTLSGASVVVSTKGGGGSAAGNGVGGGTDGGTSVGPASGGTNSTLPRGGNGGTEEVMPESAPDSSTNPGGGGGGSVGQSLFLTRDGTMTLDGGAVVRSVYVVDMIGTREVP